MIFLHRKLYSSFDDITFFTSEDSGGNKKLKGLLPRL